MRCTSWRTAPAGRQDLPARLARLQRRRLLDVNLWNVNGCHRTTLQRTAPATGERTRGIRRSGWRERGGSASADDAQHAQHGGKARARKTDERRAEKST